MYDSHSVTMPCGVEQCCCADARHLVAEVADVAESVAEKGTLVDNKAFEGGLIILYVE